MNVRELIELLKTADPELPVCTFDESGAWEIGRACVCSGEYTIDTEKLARLFREAKYVGLGEPRNYEATETDDLCHLVKEL